MTLPVYTDALIWVVSIVTPISRRRPGCTTTKKQCQ